MPTQALPLRLIVSLLALAWALPAFAADWEGVYEGTLGKARIIVQLVEPLDDMEGTTQRETSRYSYVPKARDLNLFLTDGGKVLRFEETPQQPYEFAAADGAKKITGRWELQVKGDKASGTWTSADGQKKLPFALTAVAELPAEEVNPDLNAMNETYNHLWLKSVSYAPTGEIRKFNAIEIRFVKDSAFGIEFPVLGAFPDAARKAKANALLMKAHAATVSSYRDCKSAVPEEWQEASGEAEMGYDVKYASDTVLSFTESGSVSCGGAHPNNYVTPITYDLTAPAQMGGRYNLDLSPEGFGQVLKLGSAPERIAFERYALGLWKDGEARDTEMEEACKTGFIDDAPEGAKMFSLSFEPRGLAVLRTDFPHAATVCLATHFNPTIIPWVDLKPWLKPGQGLLKAEVP